MKTIRWRRASLILLLCWGMLLSPANAMAGAETVFALLDSELRKDTQTEQWSVQEACAILGRIASAGIAVPQRFILKTESEEGAFVPKYSWSLALLETQLGKLATWSLEDKHRLDQMMVGGGLLGHIFYLLPSQDEIDLAQALLIGKDAVQKYYGASIEDLDKFKFEAFYVASEEYPPAIWRLRFATQGELSDYDVVITSRGEIIENLFLHPTLVNVGINGYYFKMIEERGAFFTLPLSDKAWLSDHLNELITKELEMGGEVFPELQTVADYRFCMPTPDSIPQQQALKIAIEATQKAFGFSDGWQEDFSAYYSYFPSGKDKWTWRVVFWGAYIQDYCGGLVEMDANTGTVLAVKLSGGKFDTAIPYLDRL